MEMVPSEGLTFRSRFHVALASKRMVDSAAEFLVFSVALASKSMVDSVAEFLVFSVALASKRMVDSAAEFLVFSVALASKSMVDSAAEFQVFSKAFATSALSALARLGCALQQHSGALQLGVENQYRRSVSCNVISCAGCLVAGNVSGHYSVTCSWVLFLFYKFESL